MDIDSSRLELETALNDLAKEGLLGLRVPKEFGGKGFKDSEFRLFQEACARASGALAFLQTEHQSACSFILKGTNDALKRRALPKMARG